MKRIFYFLSIIAASVAFAACNVTEVIEETPEVGVKVLTAYTDNDIATKTSLNGVSVIWSESDVITAFDAECVGYSSSQTQISQNGKVAQFTIEGLTVEDDVMMALYPANTSATMDEDMVITTEIPVEQIAVANSFANGANVAIAEGQGTELKFKNAGAILSFTLNDSDVKSVKLTTLDSKAVAGPCDICLDGGVLCCATTDSENDSVILTAPEGQCLQANTSYYFVVIPDEFSGFRLEFTNSDGQTAKLKNATPVDLNSNDNYFIGDIPTLANKWKGGDTPNPARFEKVTSAPDNGDWSGDYLIVYEMESLAFDGSLTTLDATSNTKPVTIEDAIIAATSDMMAIRFTVAKKSESSDKYNLKSASGYYISGTTTNAAASNGIKQSTSDSAYEITFGVENNNVVVYSKSSNQNMILRYNAASNQNRFRFYKSGQNAISLYKFYGTIQSIPVESVSLDIEEYELGEGSHVQLIPTVAPAEATNKNVTWSTSDDSVATVENGLVTAVGEGTATITVTTEDGGFAAECEITVLPKYDITISSEIANGTVSSNVASAIAGTEITLTATPDAAYKFTSWDVKDASENNITVTDNKFTMPASAVTVNASFSQILLEDMDAIFAKATEVGNKAADVFVKFTNYAVSGAKDKNVYVTDGAKGFIIFESSNGFVANDRLNGTIQCKVQLFNGSAELTGVTASSIGLTVTKGEALVAQTIPTGNLSGINTGVLLTYSAMKYNSTTKKLSDGTNTIEPYTTLYSYTSLTNGQKYDVTGVYLQYNDKQEVLPRSAEEITKYVAPSYNITIADNIANGTVSASQTSAQEGVQITLTPNPSEGYRFGAWDVKDSDGIAITVTDNKFTMPAKDIIVSATFTQKENHAIKISSSIANGTVTASLSEAYEGQEITLTATPADNYKFSEWSVKDAENNVITVDANNKFTMPDAEVTVSATFVSSAIPDPVAVDKTIANYPAGTQYAKNEKHDLGDGFVIYTTDCHFTSELRIYSSTTNNGYVISDPFSGPISEIRFNAGYKADTVNVYGSNDGETWKLVGGVKVTSTYTNYSLSFGTNSYKQFKLDVAGSNQVRIKTLGVTYTPAN